MARSWVTIADRIRAVLDRLSRERVLLPGEVLQVAERMSKKYSFGNWWRSAACATKNRSGALLRGRMISEWINAAERTEYRRLDALVRLDAIERRGRAGPLDAELCVLHMAIENHQEFSRLPYDFRRNTMKGLRKIGR